MDKATLIRTITLAVVSVLDLFVVLTGINIGVTEEQILAIVTVVVGFWVWWKNNSVTSVAKRTDALMRLVKRAVKENDLVILDKIDHILEEDTNDKRK